MRINSYYSGPGPSQQVLNQISKSVLAHNKELDKQRKQKQREDDRHRYSIMSLLLDLGVKSAHEPKFWTHHNMDFLMGPSLSDLFKGVYGDNITKAFSKKK